MIKILFFIFLTLSPALTRADFEQDLSATGNIPLSLRELRARAQTGNADAQLNMGGVYFKGQEIEQDYAESATWFRLAALQGKAQAQYNLGMMYDTGMGVAQDHTEAARWYRLAAGQHLAAAQLNLGVAYATGVGVPENATEAIRWLRLAADQGEVQAQFNLGVMYAKGQGVKQDLVEAYRYTRLAADQGHKIAPSLLADLDNRMTPEQRAKTRKPETTIKQKPVPSPATGEIYLQLGAFKAQNQAENHAKRFMAEMQARLGDIGKPYRIFNDDGWVDIQVGPYSSKSEAQQSAGKLKAQLGFAPMLKRY